MTTTHAHDHAHHSRDAHASRIEQDILAKNDASRPATGPRFTARSIAAFNFTSAPGSGKTSLLEAIIKRSAGRSPLAVIEGDQETARDADRIRATGAPVVQINTRHRLPPGRRRW